MVATTTFSQRHTLARNAINFEVDQAVERCLPEGTRVLEAVPWGASAWTTTSKVVTELADGTPKSYFLKTAQERGAIMMEGEFNSLQAIDNVSPGFVPKAHGWGKYESSDTYFLIMDFIDLKMTMPDPNKLCQILTDMHRRSESPTGKFGFHVPTCHGKHIQSNDWETSWCKYFTRLITVFFATDIEVNGHWKEYEEAFETLKTHVIPKILEPLQADGRVLKPSLVHGDLWEENTGTNVENGQLMVYDASVMYAHNEYELGMWRNDYMRIGSAHFKQYLRRLPPSDPVHQWDDRNLLYSLKFALAHSSGWQGSTTTREKILEDMHFLIKKYSGNDTDQAAFDMNNMTTALSAGDDGAERRGAKVPRAVEGSHIEAESSGKPVA